MLNDPAAARCQPCESRRRGLCRGMGRAAHADLFQQSRTVSLPPGYRLIDEDGPAAAVWIVQAGVLRVQRFGPEGRRQIVGLFLPGEVAEKIFPDSAGCTVEAATPVELCRIDRRDFAACMDRSPALRRAMTQQRLDRLERMRWLIWVLGALRPEERICAFLAFATRVLPVQPQPGGALVLCNAVPRADLADLLATSAETYSRVSHRLQDAGILKIETPERFRILDLPALARIGGLGGAVPEPGPGSGPGPGGRISPRSGGGSAPALR